ncbi:MAG: hypothetical protein WCG27_01585, partial [Pseudomonadota bacterium]
MLKLLALLAIIFSCSHISRDPSSELRADQDSIKVAVRKLSDNNKLILIGLDRQGTVGTEFKTDQGVAFYKKSTAIKDHRPYQNPVRLDTRQLGFSGEDIAAMEPKYLMEVNAEGVQNVYAFDLDEYGDEVKPYGSARHPVYDASWYWPAFPKKLLSVPKAKTGLWMRFLFRGLLHLGSLTAASPAFALFRQLELVHENPKQYSASYLRYLVEGALDRGLYPQLQKELSPQQLEDLG